MAGCIYTGIAISGLGGGGRGEGGKRVQKFIFARNRCRSAIKFDVKFFEALNSPKTTTKTI